MARTKMTTTMNETYELEISRDVTSDEEKWMVCDVSDVACDCELTRSSFDECVMAIAYSWPDAEFSPPLSELVED